MMNGPVTLFFESESTFVFLDKRYRINGLSRWESESDKEREREMDRREPPSSPSGFGFSGMNDKPGATFDNELELARSNTTEEYSVNSFMAQKPASSLPRVVTQKIHGSCQASGQNATVAKAF